MKEGKVALSSFLPLREAEEPAAIIIVVPAALSDEQTRKSERLSLLLSFNAVIILPAVMRALE